MTHVAELHPSQVQSAWSTAPSKSGDGHLRFLHNSVEQASMLSNVSNFREARLNHFRAMTQTPAARIAAFSAIDQDIIAAMQFTRSLLSCRNSLVPISALPPELLSRIFHFHACLEPPQPKLGWIVVTHVCQYWRQVALNDPLLWAEITGYSPRARWTSEILVRARNAPVVIDLFGTPSPEVLSKFPPHISHTRELRLRNLSKHHSQGIQEICALEAPVLENFELKSSTVATSTVTFRQFAGTTLFNGQTPKLRMLSLYQISIPWSLIPHGQLTQLKIILSRRAFKPDNSSPNDLNQFIDLLVNSPELEVLAIDFCLPTMLSEVSNGQPIHLPRLSRLCLGGSTASVVNLLKMLRLPSSATLHLHCISESSLTRPDHLILPLVSAHFHNPAPVEFKSFRANVDYSRCHMDVAASIALPEWTIYDYPILEDERLDSEAELTLSFDGLPKFGESRQAEILGRLCSMLNISNVEILSISASENIPSLNWFELFRQCNSVTTIQAWNYGTIGLLQDLAPQKVSDARTDSKGKKRRRNNGATRAHAADNALCPPTTTTPFPKLTGLYLNDLDFGLAMPHSGTLYDVLMNTLQSRKKNKMPLKVLGVDNCVITCKNVNSLKKRVEKFSWDGHLGDTEDEWDDSERDDSESEYGDSLGFASF